MNVIVLDCMQIDALQNIDCRDDFAVERKSSWSIDFDGNSFTTMREALTHSQLSTRQFPGNFLEQSFETASASRALLLFNPNTV